MNFLPPLPLHSRWKFKDTPSVGVQWGFWLPRCLSSLGPPARCSNALFVISLIHEPPRCPRRKLIMRARTLGIGDGHKAATAEMPSSRHQERACATLIVRSSNNHLLCSLAGRVGRSQPCLIPTVTSFGSALMNWRKVSPTSTEPGRESAVIS